ncbi:phosphatase PAP2 family protein [Cryptosporangium aurantiacum]|uniref:PAP2 superfamily protein n=1 Tax=Cryptosporangium aurantiacum TaxID=134849 RepID=A0A1M7QT31_9ACTN|nr:phosphatase PAP2 family protein [Cryptosporangium aurantiacum]SHN34587.1 PAP2 superfamily protein [Cryptosporangium aurantiacum]
MSPTWAAAKQRTARPWWTAALAATVFAAITVGVATGFLLGIDRSMAEGSAEHRASALYWPARAGFSLGQNWVFPAASAVAAVALAIRRRSARPVVGLVGVWLVHTLVVGSAKLWAGRPPPGTGDPHLHAVAADLHLRMSYPSGHAANVVVFSATLAVLVVALTGDRRWMNRLLIVGAVSLTICGVCMIYLGYHWATDAFAGAALGVALGALAVTAFARWLR